MTFRRRAQGVQLIVAFLQLTAQVVEATVSGGQVMLQVAALFHINGGTQASLVGCFALPQLGHVGFDAANIHLNVGNIDLGGA